MFRNSLFMSDVLALKFSMHSVNYFQKLHSFPGTIIAHSWVSRCSQFTRSCWISLKTYIIEQISFSDAMKFANPIESRFLFCWQNLLDFQSFFIHRTALASEIRSIFYSFSSMCAFSPSIPLHWWLRRGSIHVWMNIAIPAYPTLKLECNFTSTHNENRYPSYSRIFNSFLSFRD